MKIVCKFIFLFGTILPLIFCRRVPFFRKDYTFSESFDAFYKLHWGLKGSSWNSAFLACDDEGATLFYPTAKGELSHVKALIEDFKDAPNFTDIFVGIHDKFGIGEFITVDGHPSPVVVEDPARLSRLLGDNCVLMNIATETFTLDACIRDPDPPLPFICKKVQIELCPTVDQDYKYIKASRKCYKVNKRERVWDEAMQTCYMEGGILAVLETEDEADRLLAMLTVDSNYHVGFRKTFPGNDYYTVKGQKLDDMYHKARSSQQQYYDENIPEEYRLYQECGSLNRDSSLYVTTHDCNVTLPFICEMQANI